MSSVKFAKYVQSSKRCHLIGIGGVSMSPLAIILHNTGIEVSGSDINDSTVIKELRDLGITVYIGHHADNIVGAGYIVRTAAARDDNVEVEAAQKNNIPVFERAEAWGHIMRSYKDALCISGVHGKTTTTSMVSRILLAAGTDPTVMIGGTLPKIESGCLVGKGDIIVLEACEYYNSFHNFHPTVALILNIDADHLDFFKDLDGLKSSFRHFASLVPKNGYIICNGDDENTMDALTKLDRELITFGFNEFAAVTGKPIRLRGTNVKTSGRHPSMDISFDGNHVCSIKLRIPGVHNLKNALAAAAACLYIGISPKIIEDELLEYSGVGRRFEYKGSYNGADVFDDYAHHPRELSALIDAVSTFDCYNRFIIAFQPHTYSRTRALFDDFVSELKRPDVVFLSDIYAAREQPIDGVSSQILADAVPESVCISDFGKMTEQIAAIARKGDIVITVGAGDIYKVGESLVSR
ncbi:MAG: UDP-N-acetylmuramate--L-alanine ligase [Oscillospiraceae bacterium]|jgi:UDP-N-acetylmuramate--alanine ligase|nr:UDP-N-acetylmuramate--L-alanine ligase [Oscillospiraceae bacterium]